MESNTTVTFICRCGDLLNTSFNKEYYNYHTVGCASCGSLYEVHRPQIADHTNLSRADEDWLNANGFDDGLPTRFEGSE